MSLPRLRHYSLGDVAKKLRITDAEVLEHVVHHGLQVTIWASDYLLDEAGMPSDQQFATYCRLTNFDVAELVGKGTIWRPYLLLFKNATEPVADLKLGRIGMWIKPVQMLVLEEDLERFSESQKNKSTTRTDTDRPKASWVLQVQEEAAKRWKKWRASGANPTRNSLKDELSDWCRENGVLTTTGINPSPETIYKWALRNWEPPKD